MPRIMEQIELRPEVRIFAEAMEQKLRENEHKGGWKTCNPNFLYARFRLELEEFGRAFNTLERVGVLDEAADVANYLMMICDNLGLLR